MNGIVGSLRLGWDALLFKDEAYEKMRTTDDPVIKGLILIVVVGLVIALLAIIGTALEVASTPNLAEMQATIFDYIQQMPWWRELAREAPGFRVEFENWYNWGWDLFPGMFGASSIAGAALNVITTPLGLVIRWLIYGLLAFLFARWLGGTADLSETLGVLALAVAPQALHVLELLPFVQVGSVVSIWGLLIAYLGLKTTHKLSWGRAVWATLLPYLLFFALVILGSCLGSTIFVALLKGG
jgi:hypothetical protein